MPNTLQQMGYQNGIDPETLKMMALYFGGRKRIPSPMPSSSVKPTTKLKPTVVITPEMIVAAGGLPVEAGDIAMHTNQGLAAGLGMQAFEAVPPELRTSLLSLLLPNKQAKAEAKAEAKAKAKKGKLPTLDSFYKEQLVSELAKPEKQGGMGLNRTTANLLLKDFFKGNYQALPYESLPSSVQDFLSRSGRTDTVRDAQTPKPVGRVPTEKYFEQAGGRYVPAERPAGSGRELYGPTYWDQRANTDEDWKPYMPKPAAWETEPLSAQRPPSEMPTREEAMAFQKEPMLGSDLLGFLKKLGLIVPGDPETMVGSGRRQWDIPTPGGSF
jgi:hypothetical protein